MKNHVVVKTTRTFIKIAMDMAFILTDLGKMNKGLYIADKRFKIKHGGHSKEFCYRSRRIINPSNNTIVVFVGLEEKNGLVDVLEVYGTYNGEVWIYNQLSNPGQPYSKVKIRQSTIVENNKHDWDNFVNHFSNTVRDYIN